jgi:hypothetical protein
VLQGAEVVHYAVGALGLDLTRRLTPLDETALTAKIEAVRCYRSQISSFWHDDSSMAQALREYAAENGGEGEWCVAEEFTHTTAAL